MTEPVHHRAPEIDSISGKATTGHEWDGLTELNTPLPRWWLWTFYATIVWSIGYWIVYPAWPLIEGHTAGLWGHTNRAAVARDIHDLERLRAARSAGLATASLEEIKANPTLHAAALARGRTAFGDNCQGCHAQGGAGVEGAYPNLADDDWLWGGTLPEIHRTIQHGVRWTESPESRAGEMLAFGRAGVLKKEEIATVVEYVRSLATLDVQRGADLAAGKALFEANCASCHGDAGMGNRELGAPDLTDAIWLFGKSRATMIDVVTNGRASVMPAWAGRLDPVTIKALAVYVHALGGGQ
jgi:cytochrome c oxidase cbb3-type subunit 3